MHDDHTRPDSGLHTVRTRPTGDDLLSDAIGALLGIPLRERIDRHLLNGQRAEAAIARVRAIPRVPHISQQIGVEGRAYTRGWEAVIAMVDNALAECCVCGGTPVVYRNYRKQPFCGPCANCDCDQDVCVRTRPKPAADDTDQGRPFTELSTAGLLWLINRSLFHPSGLALALHVDADGRATGWSLQRSPDDTPYEFEPEVDAEHIARARATLDAALDAPRAGQDSVRTADDERPDMGGIVSGLRDVGETAPGLTSVDTVRTVSEDTSVDSPDTGFRFEYRARVPRGLAGLAFAEAFGLLHDEMNARTIQPGESSEPVRTLDRSGCPHPHDEAGGVGGLMARVGIDTRGGVNVDDRPAVPACTCPDAPAPRSAELVHRDDDPQVSVPDAVDDEPLRLLHLVHGTVPLHEHLAAADRAQQTIDDLHRRNNDLAATLGDVLTRFTVEAQIGAHAVRTGYVGAEALEGWRQVLAGNRAP